MNPFPFISVLSRTLFLGAFLLHVRDMHAGSVPAAASLAQTMDLQAPIVLQKPPIIFSLKDITIEWASRIRVESFFGMGQRWFNPNPLDQVLIPAKHTIDSSIAYGLGKDKLGYELLRVKATLRTRGTWGNEASIVSTASAMIKDADVTFGAHEHTINRFIMWMRELWFDVALGGLFSGDPASNTHIMLGFFPFELGRGIALGAAYAKDPDILGYSPATAIDQYAPGFKLSGDFIGGRVLSWDLYAAILKNRSDSFKNVNMPILGQEFGKRCTPERGFGVISYILAGRLQFRPFQEKDFNLSIEPYWLYERQKEQKIEFMGDANMHLGTIGFAWNMERCGFIFDFEFAQNIGVQDVPGWDRNTLTKENRDGIAYYVNTDVTAIADSGNDVAGKRAVVTKTNQVIIDSAPQNQLLNGQQIGTSNLQNSATRFSNPYRNWLTGRMFVGDIGYRFAKNFRVAMEVGVATGDTNPNRDILQQGDSNQDRKYRGFISLQEVYSGNLVRSAFLFNGSAEVPRISNFAHISTGNGTADVITKFNNLIYWGGSAEMKGTLGDRPWSFMPNLITYWQEHPLHLFPNNFPDQTHAETPVHARNWMGIEFNVFSDIMLAQDFKFFFSGAIFIPGTYYKDIAGRGITDEQQGYLDAVAANKPPRKQVLFAGTSTAFFLNTGMEYRF